MEIPDRTRDGVWTTLALAWFRERMTEPSLSLATAFFLLDAGLRGGAIALFALAGVIFARSPGSLSARIGIPLSICAILATLSGLPPIRHLGGLDPVVALGANAIVPLFWLFARAWFDDDYRPSALDAVCVAGFVALGLYADVGGKGLAAPVRAIDVTLYIGSTALAGHALWLAWRDRQGDLVEPRRRARGAFVLTVGAIILWSVWSEVIGRLTGELALSNLSSAVALFAGALAIATILFGLRHPDIFPLPSFVPAPSAPIAVAEPVDMGLAQALDRMMVEDRAYRDPDLTIGAIATRLNVPEYRLRRLINAGLGHRNVSAFLNDHRIQEIRAALADPAQADVPILTMAMDAGFGSLAVFNRAFKDRLGETPSAFRRRHLGAAEGVSSPPG